MVWLVPSPFRATWYTNDDWHLPGDNTLEKERLKTKMKENLQFWGCRSPSMSRHFSSSKIPSVQEQLNADLGKQLLVHYRSKHGFHG